MGYIVTVPMRDDAKVFVAGHRGMVGSSIVRLLEASGFTNVVTRTSAELDLRDPAAVDAFFAVEKPEYVFLAAAKVGGILANSTYPADFLLDNLRIQNSVIESARVHGVRKLMFLGSSCIYPRDAEQPIVPSALLTGPLEETNEAYAIAKIAGIKLCQAMRTQYDFDAICVMPTNLYGPGDSYHPENSHVLPALVRKFAEAKESGAREVTVWGTGRARRDFLHVDDLAEACLLLMDVYSGAPPVNVGTLADVTISELVEIVRGAVGYEGDVVYDHAMPDGTPKKLMDTGVVRSLGWSERVSLVDGVAGVVAGFSHPGAVFRET